MKRQKGIGRVTSLNGKGGGGGAGGVILRQNMGGHPPLLQYSPLDAHHTKIM